MAMNNIIINVFSCISVASKAACNDIKMLNLLQMSKYIFVRRLKKVQ